MTPFDPLAKHKSTFHDIQRAKQLRKEAPLCERLLWEALMASAKIEGLRFRRQHPIHPYIVDFVCLKAKLIIEIDGESHEARQDYDENRTHYLVNFGYRVLRYTNNDVRENLEGIVQTIISEALDRTTEIYIPLP